MKQIGLVGGLSPESTVEYYQYICRKYNKEQGSLNFPDIVIRSVNLQRLIECFENNDWSQVTTIITNAVNDCEDAGAEFVAICANTPHNAYDEIIKRCNVKVLGIMEATANAIKSHKVSKVGLLGTLPTMEYGFFQKTFDQAGIETLVPDKNDRVYIDKTIWNELSHGKILLEDRNKHKKIIRGLVNKGAQGIILGCTELPLLINENDSAVPLFDTLQIHAQAILDYALEQVEC